MKNILHITNWYPNKDNPMEALFIKRQLLNLQNFCNNELWHIEVRAGAGLFSFQHKRISSWETSYIIQTKVNIWFLKEMLTSTLLFYLLLRRKILKWQFDAINFHIAYPLCLGLYWIQKFIKTPIYITEHWTAYRKFFNLTPNSRKLKKVKRIFHNQLFLITVSNALLQDIIRFSGNKKIKYSVVPNFIDTNIFNYKPKLYKEITFFILNNWSTNKRPEILIKAFAGFLKSNNRRGILKIGGYGIKWNEIISLVEAQDLQDNVRLLGKLSEPEIAFHMNSSHAFVQCSDYETFSIVCAEAVCCGCPVIANKLPALEEYLDAQNSIMVDIPEVESYVSAFHEFFKIDFDRKSISQNAHIRFDPDKTGWQYLSALTLSDEVIL